MVLTRTALSGAGHYQIHRKWKQQRGRSLTLPMGKALFDINYVGTSLIGTDGHVLLHHPYLGSGADVKKTFFDSMLRLHPVLRIPGYTLHKLGICLTGVTLRAWETTGEELAVIPEAMRNDWAAQQICTSYDLSVVGNRWIDLFLSAGLSPHRVHHVLPWQGSGFANLASEAAVREACEEAGIAWERPRNLIFGRFPVVIKHYLLCPVKAARTPDELPMPPSPPGSLPAPPARSGMGQIGDLFRYTLDGFRGVGV